MSAGSVVPMSKVCNNPKDLFIHTPFASMPPTTAVRSTLFTELILTACERALSRNWFGGKRACPWLFSLVGPNKVFRLILSS